MEMTAIAPNNAVHMPFNVNDAPDNTLKTDMARPSDRVLGRCLEMAKAAPYPLMLPDEEAVAINWSVLQKKIAELPRQSSGLSALPTALFEQLQQSLARAAAVLAAQDAPLAVRERFERVLAGVQQAAVINPGDLGSMHLFMESIALGIDIDIIEQSLTPAILDKKLITVMALLEARAGALTNAPDQSHLRAALADLSAILMAMQTLGHTPEAGQLKALSKLLASINLQVADDPSLLQMSMRAQTTSAKLGLLGAGGGDLDGPQLQQMLALEVMSATVALTVLDSAQPLDDVTRIAYQSDLLQAFQTVDQMATLTGATLNAPMNMPMSAPSRTVERSSAADMLDSWTKMLDLNLALLNNFVDLLISLRQTMRENRQAQLEIFQMKTTLAIDALNEQRKNNFIKELVTAGGQILSGVMQLGPVAKGAITKMLRAPRASTLLAPMPALEASVPTAPSAASTPAASAASSPALSRRGSTAASNRAATHARQPDVVSQNFEMKGDNLDVAGTVKPSKSTSSAEVASSASKKSKSTKDPVADPSVDPKADPATPSKALSADAKAISDSARVQVEMMVMRGIGEILQGLANIVAAVFGSKAAEAGAQHYRHDREGQVAQFQRSVSDQAVTEVSENIAQELRIIADMQDKQFEISKRIFG